MKINVEVGGTTVESTVIDNEAMFPEGPIFVKGKLYYVETGANRVSVLDGTEKSTLFQRDGLGPNAVTTFCKGLLVAGYFSNSVLHISLNGELIEEFDKADDGTPMIGPNDLVPDGIGGVYFTASGPWETDPIVGKVFHISSSGRLRQMADDIHYANGIVLANEGTRLLVAESEAFRIISFAIGEDGTLSDRRVFVRVPQADKGAGPDGYPDGIKFGPDGNLYIAQYSSGRIAVVTPTGEFVRAYKFPAAGVSNLTFTPDGKSLVAMVIDDKSGAPWPGKLCVVDLVL
ncbi:gluconolactonase [Paraburkholderia sp. BL27I4N3]|uniref:SMP-30/gluconolactonase/LRE family protein n=1 Tax=Paraburkholderia sp. BL27I4N3 TaxID=1938805 RepID=UPI000E3704CD|nr:SMP-30/gluconolactonase/LRE family protein [Paraburkholderia sp. BL27I4N3]REE18129.1 gluconolactonase [Paraburkholderia sp. BL27I4N3]